MDIVVTLWSDPTSSPALTPPEWEVARLVAQGLSDREVADQLDIRVHTVKTRLAGVHTKLGAVTRPQVAAWVLVNLLRTKADRVTL